MGTIWKPTLDHYAGAKYQRLVSAIQDAIADSTLAPNAKLPPQRRLADMLGVTVGTVTRAYALAEQRGLVEARVGDGTYVKYSDPIDLSQSNLNMATCQQPLTDQVARLSDSLQSLAKEPAKLAALLGYHGVPLSHQQQIFSQWLNRRGIAAKAEHLLFTHGAQQGIFSTLNALLTAQDTLFHEAYSYPGIRIAANQLGITAVGVPLTEEGLDLEALERLAQIHQPKLIYLTLNNQNPTCIQYTDSQRSKILDLAKQYNFWIVEDDVNYCLPEEWHAPLWSHPDNDGRVIYISSLSKLFSGGLRQGFMLIPSPLMTQITQALHSQCWMVSPLNVELACQLISNGELVGERETLIRQRQALCIAMGERLGLKQCWRGLNGWLQLKPSVKAHHAVTALAVKGILVRNGDDFDNKENYIRLSIGGIANESQFMCALEEIEHSLMALSQHAYSVV